MNDISASELLKIAKQRRTKTPEELGYGWDKNTSSRLPPNELVLMNNILKEIDAYLTQAEEFKDYKDETFYDGFVCALKLIKNEILHAQKEN